MGYQEVELGTVKFRIPEYYEQGETIPEDPEGSVCYTYSNNFGTGFIIIFPIGKDGLGDFNLGKNKVLERVRSAMSDDQALIEVGTGKDFLYSIIKEVFGKQEKNNVQYNLSCVRYVEGRAFKIVGFFVEEGLSGLRDAVIYNQCVNQKIVGTEGDPFYGWRKDPYDEDLESPVLMNLSEKEEFDILFPDHVLTRCRETFHALTEG